MRFSIFDNFEAFIILVSTSLACFHTSVLVDGILTTNSRQVAIQNIATANRKVICDYGNAIGMPVARKNANNFSTCTIEISWELTEPEALADFLRRGSASLDIA